jgi:hypothetical protein
MANRHERRKAAKLSVETMSVSDFMQLPSGCAWAGCGKGTKNPDGDGWSKLLLYKGRTHSDFMAIAERDMQRDAVLCPEHAAYLDHNLLFNIGGQLRETMGAA